MSNFEVCGNLELHFRPPVHFLTGLTPENSGTNYLILKSQKRSLRYFWVLTFESCSCKPAHSTSIADRKKEFKQCFPQDLKTASWYQSTSVPTNYSSAIFWCHNSCVFVGTYLQWRSQRYKVRIHYRVLPPLRHDWAAGRKCALRSRHAVLRPEAQIRAHFGWSPAVLPKNGK